MEATKSHRRSVRHACRVAQNIDIACAIPRPLNLVLVAFLWFLDMIDHQSFDRRPGSLELEPDLLLEGS